MSKNKKIIDPKAPEAIRKNYLPKSYKGVVLTSFGWCDDFEPKQLMHKKFYKTAKECAIAINGTL